MSLTRAFIASLLLAALALSAGCGGGGVTIKPVRTQILYFQADPKINYGQILPVDIVYVTYLHDLREIIAIGPSAWFDSDKRQMWAGKQSLGIVGGQKVKLDLNPVLVSRSPFIAVFATFKGVSNPAAQQVVLDSQASESEVIMVRPHALDPLNPALKEFE